MRTRIDLYRLSTQDFRSLGVLPVKFHISFTDLWIRIPQVGAVHGVVIDDQVVGVQSRLYPLQIRFISNAL